MRIHRSPSMATNLPVHFPDDLVQILRQGTRFQCLVICYMLLVLFPVLALYALVNVWWAKLSEITSDTPLALRSCLSNSKHELFQRMEEF